MSNTYRQIMGLAMVAALCAQHVFADSGPSDVAVKMKKLEAVTRLDDYKTITAGTKGPFTIRKGDAEITLGGKVKISHFYQNNMYLLNKNIPDENQYFKEAFDFTIDAAYGEEKYGCKAVEVYGDIQHKGVWGRNLTAGDRDSGPTGPSNVKFTDSTLPDSTVFGTHSHTTNKTFLWLREGWLKFGINPALGCHSENFHFLQLGWFPFELGRGIAHGSFYGTGQEIISLYSAGEDKFAPGILLTGSLIKDRLSYDLYYSRFEERGKSLDDNLAPEKAFIVGRTGSPWRGTGKNNDKIAGRVKWKALKDQNLGVVDLEPYIFYNAVSDRKVEMTSDSKCDWGTYGLSLEHTYQDFEWGGEVAFNYGKENLRNIDRNKSRVINDKTGQIVAIYSKITNTTLPANGPTNGLALVTAESTLAAQQPFYTNGAPIPGTTTGTVTFPTGRYVNANNRFRPAYENKLSGWMAVVDGAYTFQDWNLKLAVAYGYASGDNNPHSVEKDKHYHGFVGLHELYSGKRVKSILLLDERLLRRPVSIAGSNGRISASKDINFTDLQHVGIGATWAPKTCIRDLSINPNIIGFWKAHEVNKFLPSYTITNGQVVDTSTISPTEKARTFMGTEINILSSCTVIRDLKMFANIAVFFPGGLFADVKGVPVGTDIFSSVVQDDRNDVVDASQFRLSNDTAFHLNIGFEYKF